ncbi:hypothetical protein PUN28_000796 [Cardiocondyla obscurior]|uniref:Uncharacterized protein n=1 Tax=Cardiocondyla obscurior TaxID=286306 RepID=A0AAW2H136_9HYME
MLKLSIELSNQSIRTHFVRLNRFCERGAQEKFFFNDDARVTQNELDLSQRSLVHLICYRARVISPISYDR